MGKDRKTLKHIEETSNTEIQITKPDDNGEQLVCFQAGDRGSIASALVMILEKIPYKTFKQPARQLSDGHLDIESATGLAAGKKTDNHGEQSKTDKNHVVMMWAFNHCLLPPLKRYVYEFFPDTVTSLQKNQMEDVREFLKLFMKGSTEQRINQGAHRLKLIRNELAHQTTFLESYTKSALSRIEEFLRLMKTDTSSHRRNLKQLKKYGLQLVMERCKGTQWTALKETILSENSSLGATIDSLEEQERQKVRVDEIEVNDLKMSGMWSRLPVISNYEAYPGFTREHPFIKKNDIELSNTLVCRVGKFDAIDSVASILSRAKQFNEDFVTSTTQSTFGLCFKMAQEPFAKGASRYAYRGHFDKNQKFSEFRENSEVVIKLLPQSQNNPFEAHKILFLHHCGKVLSSLWNNKFKSSEVYDGEQIVFNTILRVQLPPLDIQGFEDKKNHNVTLEPYINKKMYHKW
jgi:hypothetical protein